MDRRTFMGVAAANLVAIPLAAIAQQAAKVRRIGLLSSSTDGSAYRRLLVPALRDLGWIEGQNQ